MSRLISVALTEPQVRDRSKTQTRRLGWWEDKNGRRLTRVGQQLTACRKVQGRRRPDGTVDPLVRLADIEVVEVRRERLDTITPADVVAEGFPDWTPDEFVTFFCSSMKCPPDTVVTVIRFRYLDAEAGVR